ncbi:MAG: hypothetical protein KAX11_07115, partial [Candidatus Aminicenantes bacterium]|nr:hypothetical protein [Candidatus Aminicenantes bacterium]
MKKISVIVLFIFLPSLLFASGWKFSLGGGYRYINLNDLEAGLDSWNVLMKNVAKNKNIDEGTNIPELEDIEGITSFPGLRLSLEKEIINNLYLFFGVDMYHKSNQPVRDVGNINTDFYAIHNQLKETIDLTSLIMGIRFSPIKSKLFELGTSIDFSANFIKWNYDGIFTWDVID